MITKSYQLLNQKKSGDLMLFLRFMLSLLIDLFTFNATVVCITACVSFAVLGCAMRFLNIHH